ncbi:hypothetical protein [Pyruvatibacter sp.]
MSEIVHTETLTAENTKTQWFKNPAFWNGPEHYATAGLVPTGNGFNAGTVQLQAAIVNPDTDPNDTAPDAAAIQDVTDLVWDVDAASPRNVATVLPWLRFVASAAAPEIEIWVY